MSDTSSLFGIDLVRRGYDRDQVDKRMAQLMRDRDSAVSRISALEQRIEELLAEAESSQAQGVGAEASLEGLSPRLEQMLRLAEEEAEEVGAKAREVAEQYRKAADDAARQMREEAEAFAAELNARTDQETGRIVQTAQAQAADLRTSAQRDAKAARDNVHAFFANRQLAGRNRLA